MKVWKRIVLKVLIFVLVVAGAGAAGIALREGKRANAEYALNQYVQHLIANEAEKAYAFQDKSSDTVLTGEEFSQAAEAKKYALYAGYHIEKQETRRDDSGSEFEDYRVAFVNSDDETQAEEIITVKKQAEKNFFFFDQWLVVPDHCLVKDFRLTVPGGSSVTLDGQVLEAGLLEENGEEPAKDQYCIPTILPGKVQLRIHHPVFDDVVTEVDTTDQTVDLCKQMQLSEAGKSACMEMGVKALKEIYIAAVKDSTQELSDLFVSCQKEAEKLAGEQQQVLARRGEEGSAFQSLAVSGFNPRYGEVTYPQEGEGIQVEMNMAYHYLGKFETSVSVETGEYDADGYPIVEEDTQEDSQRGDSTAKLTFSYYEGAWHLVKAEIPSILG